MLFNSIKSLYATDKATLLKATNNKTLAIVLDTETAIKNKERFWAVGGKVEGFNSLVYDLGLIVIDLTGNVYGSLNLVISDIFKHEREKMDTCYFAEKLQSYYIDIDERVREVVCINTALEALDYLTNDLGIKTVMAYNARFDYEALTTTNEYVNNVRRFFNADVNILDIQKMLHSHVKTNRKYRKYCLTNGYMTNHKTPRPQEKAEVVYRYITRDDTFIEDHTGLKDCEIEAKIFVWLNKKNASYKKVNEEYTPFINRWMDKIEVEA